MWVIVQDGNRTSGGSTYSFDTSAVDATRKMVAVCRTEAAAGRWLGRLEQWATEGAPADGHATTVPTYLVLNVDGLADLDPGQYVGPEYYSAHGRKESLRRMVRIVRQSHAALKVERRRRGSGGHGAESGDRPGGQTTATDSGSQ
jgi:hypothetical protein